ncbi:protein phosphatase 1 regulatory subunit 3A-like [Sardina pilchardus]|uniref:protein phosphatase 1 regulatory subunit 3A-like n=1 Tax=Sardina pilchardus TaxID=27697 RepID=UPI002E105D55
MESVGAQGPKAGPCCLLPPGPCFLDEEEDVEITGIRPKCSPLPKRRSSESLDSCQPPPSSTRRVSFADAFGLSLVSVKQFSGWDVTDCSGDFLVGNTEDRDTYLLSSPFSTALSPAELRVRVQEQKLELESLTLLPGTTTLRGVVRVLNICYSKTVYVRMSLDLWKSHFDLLAEYVPGSAEDRTDVFSFRHTLVPQSSSDGVRIDFCLRYETELGTFWANNGGQNYLVFCHKDTEVPEQKDIHIKENKLIKKSCLKAPSQSTFSSMNPSTNEIPDELNAGDDSSLKQPLEAPTPTHDRAEQKEKLQVQLYVQKAQRMLMGRKMILTRRILYKHSLTT